MTVCVGLTTFYGQGWESMIIRLHGDGLHADSKPEVWMITVNGRYFSGAHTRFIALDFSLYCQNHQWCQTSLVTDFSVHRTIKYQALSIPYYSERRLFTIPLAFVTSSTSRNPLSLTADISSLFNNLYTFGHKLWCHFLLK